MWFAWDGEKIRMTHTKTRQKFKNLADEPRVALSIADPDDGYRFLEVRGVVESIEDDDEHASFYKSLQKRYGQDYPVSDAAVRVIMTIRPEKYVAVKGGSVVANAS
jgi:PPOX class probable F420-dependent enzyme